MRRLVIWIIALIASLIAIPPAARASAPCYTVSDNVITSGNSCSDTLTIPEGVTAISAYAFYAANLTSITFPNSLTTIGEGIFYRNETLTSVTFGSGLVTLGTSAFAETKLTAVTLPNSLTTMGHGAFWGISTLTSVTLGTGLTELPTEAFWGSQITSITIPGNVKNIGLRAFYNNTSLTSVTLAEGIETIGENAFANSTLITSITIPQSVYSLASTGFAGTAYTVPDAVVTRVSNKALERARSIAAAAEAQARANAAEQERRAEAARSAARGSVMNFLSMGRTPTTSDLLASGFSGINYANVAALSAEIALLGNPTLEDLVRAAKKVVIVENLASLSPVRVLPGDLADIGLTAFSSAYKSSILSKVMDAPASARATFVSIQALANDLLKEAKARTERTQEIIKKINARRG